MTDVNIPLLRKAVEWVEAQEALPIVRREWDQSHWLIPAEEREEEIAPECGTTYCVAGWIAAQHDPAYADNPWPDNKPHAAELATRLLGQTHAEGEHHIFHCENTAADVRRIAEKIAGERL